MFAQSVTINVEGHKYQIYSDCMTLEVFYIRPDGSKQELPVHRNYMTAEDAIKLHAMNMCGYCP